MCAAESPLILTVLNGAEKGRIIVLGGATADVGRGEGLDVQLSYADGRLSRRHARLERTDGGWSVVRLSSATHQTRVNGVTGDRFVLADGDELMLGDTHLKVTLHLADASALRCAVCGNEPKAPNDDGKALELMAVATYLCKKHIPTAPSGRLASRYLLCEELGRGGAGVVYKAVDERTGRVVALKRIRDLQNIEQVRRFDREMRKLRELRHINVVRFIDCGVDDGGDPFLVTEFLGDGNLADLVERHPSGVPLARAGRLIVQALDGLRFLHSSRSVHRDLKPENILLRRLSRSSTRDEYVAKIADFGLLRELDGLKLTKPHEAAGTVEFMPPEQPTHFSELRAPADTYSLGATLYFVLCSRPPIDVPAGATGGELSRYVIDAERVPIRVRLPSLPVALAEVVDRACTKSAARRFQTAEEFQKALIAAMAASGVEVES